MMHCGLPLKDPQSVPSVPQFACRTAGVCCLLLAMLRQMELESEPSWMTHLQMGLKQLRSWLLAELG